MTTHRRWSDRSFAAVLTALGMTLLVLGGCTSLEETYAGRESGQVWNAAVAAANSPEHYDDWFILENEVWADEEGRRVEVYRTIRRDLVLPGARPRRETRTMQFTINLVEEPEGPTLEFVSRHVDVPAQAQHEARVYFEDVWTLLGGRPAPPPVEEDDDDDDDDAPVNVDDL